MPRRRSTPCRRSMPRRRSTRPAIPASAIDATRLRARQRGRVRPDPRLLPGPLGVRAAHVPDPVEPRRRRARELLARLLPARPGAVRRADHAPAEPRAQEEPQAAPAARAVPGPSDQALLRPRLPGADAQVRPARAGRGAAAARPARSPRCGHGRASMLGRRFDPAPVDRSPPQPPIDPRRRRSSPERTRAAARPMRPGRPAAGRDGAACRSGDRAGRRRPACEERPSTSSGTSPRSSSPRTRSRPRSRELGAPDLRRLRRPPADPGQRPQGLPAVHGRPHALDHVPSGST